MPGLSGFVLATKESVYGTVPAFSRAFIVDSVAGQRNPIFYQARGLKRNRRGPAQAGHIETGRAPTLTVTQDFSPVDGGFWLDLIHGNTVTPVQQGSTAAYKQTHNVGLTESRKSVSLQSVLPDIGGTDRPFTYSGGKVTSTTISNDTDGSVKLAQSLICKDEVTSVSAGTPTYPTGPEVFTSINNTAVTLNGSDPGVVTTASLTMDTPEQPRRGLNTSGTTLEPLAADYNAGSIALASEFTDLTQQAAFIAGTVFPVVLEWTGDVIESTFHYKLTCTMPTCKIVGESPSLDGPGILDNPLTLAVLWPSDGTAPFKVELTTTRTTTP
jgi:hypothetical protein